MSFEEFKTPDTKVPNKLSTNISEEIKTLTNPSFLNILLKLTLIQGFIGINTMLFCPQFNMSLTNSYQLFHYFYTNFGHSICMLICGSIFLGSGAIFASHILTRDEIRIMRKTSLLYYLAQSIVAISIFMTLGAELYLNLVSFWMLGAVITSSFLFEVSYRLRNSTY